MESIARNCFGYGVLFCGIVHPRIFYEADCSCTSHQNFMVRYVFDDCLGIGTAHIPQSAGYVSFQGIADSELCTSIFRDCHSVLCVDADPAAERDFGAL